MQWDVAGTDQVWVRGVEQGTKVAYEARQVAAELQADGKPLVTWFIRYAPVTMGGEKLTERWAVR